MPNAFLVPNGYVAFCKEVTRGTVNSGGTASWIPVTSPQVTPNQMFLRDESLRGSPVKLYDEVQGVRHDEYDAKFYLFADTFPIFVKALLGGTDTVTTSTSSYSHAIPLLNSASTGSQPPSYTIEDFDGANYFVLTNGQASDMTLTFGAEVAADAQVKWITNPYTSATSASAPFTSPSWSTEHLIPSWDTTVSIGGSSFTNVASGELTITRSTAPIFTLGAQAPLYNFAGPIDVSGKFTLVVNSNADVFSTGGSAYGLTRSPEAVVITLTDPNDTHSAISDSISFTMTDCQFQMPKRTRGKDYLELEVEFHAEANTTDGGGSPNYSPITATIVNGVSGAF